MKSNRIAIRRAALKLTQNDLAELSGLSQPQISRYEAGINEPTGQALVVLAKALQTSIDWLLGTTDDPAVGLDNSTLSEKEKIALDAWRRGDRLEAIRTIANDE